MEVQGCTGEADTVAGSLVSVDLPLFRGVARHVTVSLRHGPARENDLPPAAGR